MSLCKPPRLLIITLAAAGAVAMTACGDETEPDNPTPADDHGEQEDHDSDSHVDEELSGECHELANNVETFMEQGRDTDPEQTQALADDVREFAEGHPDEDVVEVGEDLAEILDIAAEDPDSFIQDPEMNMEFVASAETLMRSCAEE